jgi:hypothetical protein
MNKDLNIRLFLITVLLHNADMVNKLSLEACTTLLAKSGYVYSEQCGYVVHVRSFKRPTKYKPSLTGN